MAVATLSRKKVSKKKTAVTVAKKKAVKKKPAETYGIQQTKSGIIFTAYEPAAGSVQIAGDFNNWQPTPMRKSSGVWKVKLSLPAGKYCYRLIIDNCWQQDPNNTDVEPNPYGELNSVLVVN